MSYEIKCVNSITFRAEYKKTHQPVMLNGKVCEGFSPNQIIQKLTKAGIK
jgi:hypothetical protein